MSRTPNADTRPVQDPIEYISAVDTAKLVRKALKEAFPNTKFSVRTDKYSGGASIRIKWTDGPTSKQVDAVADRFAGSYFDGMTDYKGGYTSRLAGQRVRFGADFIFTNRNVSTDLLQTAANRVRDEWGWENAKGERIPAPEFRVVDQGEFLGAGFDNHEELQRVYTAGGGGMRDHQAWFVALRKAERLSREIAQDSPTARKVGAYVERH